VLHPCRKRSGVVHQIVAVAVVSGVRRRDSGVRFDATPTNADAQASQHRRVTQRAPVSVRPFVPSEEPSVEGAFVRSFVRSFVARMDVVGCVRSFVRPALI
jgi:hypothetical protein